MRNTISKLINKFSKIEGLTNDTRRDAMFGNPKKVIKQRYKKMNSIQKTKFNINMKQSIIKYRELNVEK